MTDTAGFAGGNVGEILGAGSGITSRARQKSKQSLTTPALGVDVANTVLLAAEEDAEPDVDGDAELDRELETEPTEEDAMEDADSELRNEVDASDEAELETAELPDGELNVLVNTEVDMTVEESAVLTALLRTLEVAPPVDAAEDDAPESGKLDCAAVLVTNEANRRLQTAERPARSFMVGRSRSYKTMRKKLVDPRMKFGDADRFYSHYVVENNLHAWQYGWRTLRGGIRRDVA
ncbi:hypothetical protein K474DRAFT_1672889 [Panus rudis PR-1116 ss-1]|nr:hypothetical protein K474DRAFT_1672889 [Panus rudis PR-1116 ss-1]